MGFINDAGAAAVLAGESLAKHYGPEYIAFLAARSSCAGRRKPLQVLTGAMHRVFVLLFVPVPPCWRGRCAHPESC